MASITFEDFKQFTKELNNFVASALSTRFVGPNGETTAFAGQWVHADSTLAQKWNGITEMAYSVGPAKVRRFEILKNVNSFIAGAYIKRAKLLLGQLEGLICAGHRNNRYSYISACNNVLDRYEILVALCLDGAVGPDDAFDRYDLIREEERFIITLFNEEESFDITNERVRHEARNIIRNIKDVRRTIKNIIDDCETDIEDDAELFD